MNDVVDHFGMNPFSVMLLIIGLRGAIRVRVRIDSSRLCEDNVPLNCVLRKGSKSACFLFRLVQLRCRQQCWQMADDY